jgi:hypothetical protein
MRRPLNFEMGVMLRCPRTTAQLAFDRGAQAERCQRRPVSKMLVRILPIERVSDLMKCAEYTVGIVTVVPLLIGGECADQNDDSYKSKLSHINTAAVKDGVWMVHRF